MKLIDLTHPITPDMPVYPGTEPPIIKTGCSIEEAGFLEKKITFFSHTGTHVDAPAHLIKNHNTLDMLEIEHFQGPALVLDFNHLTTPDKTIGVKELEAHQDEIRKVEFLLLHTGWSQYWGSARYFTGFPVLSPEASTWLSNFPIKGLGLDTISADKIDSQDYPVHKALLRKNIIIIENLANLSALPYNQIEFSCFPLSLTDADGSPVRAVAVIR